MDDPFLKTPQKKSYKPATSVNSNCKLYLPLQLLTLRLALNVHLHQKLKKKFIGEEISYKAPS